MTPETTPRAPAEEPWHATPVDQVFDRLETTADGLTSAEAGRRFQRFGPNVLPTRGGNEALKILVRQFHDPLIYVLLASTGLAMATGKLFDGLVILGVIVLNAVIGFVQEFRASQAIKALSAMVPAQTTVLREGQRRTLPSSELVPGDVVLLQSGDKVPADLRLAEVRNLRVEEAALTGESVPVEKGSDAVGEPTGIGDRRSMAFSGTLVAYGTGTGLVVGTGGETELGRISEMLEQATDLETPLTRQLAVIGKWIAAAIVVVSVLLLGVGLLRGYPFADAVLAAVTLAVAAIPEGLPAIVTIALAIGVQRMAGRRAIVRKLPAVETLGSTTVVCSDKTGTLTRNEMTVQALLTPEGQYRLTGVGYAPEGELQDATRESGEPGNPGKPVEPTPTCASSFSPASCATTPTSGRATTAGGSPATRRRGRWWWRDARSGSRRKTSATATGASTPSPSNRSGSSWRRCTGRTAAVASPSSRGPPRSC